MNNKIYNLVRIFILEILRDFAIYLIIFIDKIKNLMNKQYSYNCHYPSYKTSSIHYFMNLDIKAVPLVSTSCNIGYAQNHVIASIGQNILLSGVINHCTIYHRNHARNIFVIILNNWNFSHFDVLYK